LVLRFAGGLETDEIGTVMGRKPNAVRQLQFRALEQLRGRMRDEAEL
jgi:DNA-directed RNA polymerase specialized sigma24 family protein